MISVSGNLTLLTLAGVEVRAILQSVRRRFISWFSNKYGVRSGNIKDLQMKEDRCMSPGWPTLIEVTERLFAIKLISWQGHKHQGVFRKRWEAFFKKVRVNETHPRPPARLPRGDPTPLQLNESGTGRSIRCLSSSLKSLVHHNDLRIALGITFQDAAALSRRLEIWTSLEGFCVHPLERRAPALYP